MEQRPGLSDEGKQRVAIEGVTPEIDCGRFAIKRTVGEAVTVEADIFSDGHEVISAVLQFRQGTESGGTAVPMEFQVNDRWRGSFEAKQLGDYFYTLEAWVNRFRSERRDLAKKAHAGQ